MKAQPPTILFHLFLMSVLSVLIGASNVTSVNSTETKVFERINSRNLIITTTINEPYVMVRKAPPGKRYLGNSRFEGFCVDVINLVCSRWNWTCTIKPTPDGRYGAPGKNGRWDGLIGQLHRGEADIAAASLAVTRARWRVVGFSPPILTTGLSIMVKRPNKHSTATLSPFWFLKPLESPVLLALVFLYVIWSVICSIASRWRTDYGRESRLKAKRPCWYNPFGCLTTPKKMAPARSVASWLLNVCWWFFTVFIVALYATKLSWYFSHVKSGVDEVKIESVEDLLDQSQVKFGTILSGLTSLLFRDSKFPLYQRMWEAMEAEEPSVFVSNYSAGVQRVRESNGRYAFLVEGLINEYISDREPCDTQPIGKLLNSVNFAFATTLKSPLKAKLDDSILEMQENGLMQKLQKKWWRDSGNGKGLCDKRSVEFKWDFNLKLEDIRGIFYLLLCGFLVALLISYVEFACLTYSKGTARRMRVQKTMDPDIYFAPAEEDSNERID